MSTADLFILAGALLGGFVNGLTGFGTGLSALSLWLYAVPPVLASPLVIICSIIGQVQTLPKIWHAIQWRRVMPFAVGGLLGTPVGTWLLPITPIGTFKIMVGGFLVLYCGFMLASRRTYNVAGGGRWADGAVGLVGGVLGGLAGLSGALPSLWANLRGWGKDERRAVFQAFNLTILGFALVTQAASGLITAEVGRLTLIALPGTLVGVWIGRRVYDRLGDRGFDRLVLVVLMLSGVAMIAITLATR